MESLTPNNFGSYTLYAHNNWTNPYDLLQKLYIDSNNEWFYKDAKTLAANLDIIFTNIALLARGTSPEVTPADVLNKFLLLFVHILDRWQTFSQNKDKLDRVRLCEILRIIVEGPRSEFYLNHISAILRKCLENFLTNDDSALLLDLFKECLQKSIQERLFHEICPLVITAINLGLHNEAVFAKDWILQNFADFMTSVIAYNCLSTALQCLEQLYKNPFCRENISNQLFPHTNSIVTLCCNNSCKHHARAILKEMISDYTVTSSTPWKAQYPPIKSLVQALPDTLHIWHVSENDIFFVISLIEQSRNVLQWRTKQILHAIAVRVTKRERIVPPVLKAMCYFFPRGIIDYKEQQWFIETSHRLINRLEWSGALREVITPSSLQLVWILKSTASITTKFFLLETWLKEDQLVNVLSKALSIYGLEDILLDYMQKFSTNPLCKKAAIVASKIKGTTLPKKITLTLMQNLTYIGLFSNLLLSKPAFPTEKHQSVAMCRALGANLPHVQDKDAFVALCDLSIKLLGSLKDEPNAMLQFCQDDGSNVIIIVGAALSPDDELGISALNLLVTLLKSQIRNDVKFAKPLKTNLARLLRGSDLRKKIALQLIKLVVSYRQRKPLCLNYSDDISLGIYQRLHNFCGTELADLSYVCLFKMLQGDPEYLTFSALTYALMDMQWNYPKPCSKSENFLKFAKYWLQLAQDSNICYLPQGMIECFSGEKEQNYNL